MQAIQSGRPVIRERGSVLFITLLVAVVVCLLGLAFMGTAMTENTVAANWRNQTTAFYAAEGGLESGFAKLKALLVNSPTPTDLQLDQLKDSARPTLSDTDFSFRDFAVRRFQPTPYTTVVDSGAYKSLSARRTDYQITAEVTGPRGSRVRLSQVVQYMEIPLFQFAVFYGRGVDLEMAPGLTPMTINGRVHANSNIYAITGSTLNFESPVTTSGKIYRYLKRDPSARLLDPQIKDASGTYRALNFDHDSNVAFAGPWSEDQWKSTALNTFGGTLLDGAMGVTDIKLPLPDLLNDKPDPDIVSHQLIERDKASDTAAMKATKLYYQADLRIVNGVGTRKDGSSVDLSGVISIKSFYDGREKKTITVTELNIRELQYDLSKIMPSGFNGILFVSNDAPDTGVRLAKGEKLPGTGLTVVSENPVYIQGNYNTKNKVPAAVLADAITVLSNNWEKNGYDTNGGQPLADRPAKDTTVNAAFALGPSTESVLGEGNGQLENAIRLLEGWGGGVTFTYSGSILSLWHSQRAKGKWICCGDYYFPAKRDWSFDTSFLTNPPPGTPSAIYIVRGRWTQE